MPPETCPNCGADVPHDAKACPECGADEETGWSETAHVSGLNLPDEEFDYDKYVKKEFESPLAKPVGIAWSWWIIAIILACLLLYFGLR